MSESTVVSSRPDADIVADIEHSITQYPPMMHDRHHVSYTAENGQVTLSGHTRTSITRRYLVETVKSLPGVVAVNADHLYGDEVTRLDVGQLMPHGVYSNVDYGVAILTGQLPEGITAEALVQAVRAVPGVRAVRSSFMN
jgi:osmotically-inducible protein OsmY